MTRAAVAALSLALSLEACAPARQGATTSRVPGPVTIQLLAINDLHGHLEPPTGSNGRIGEVDAGGTEYLATHLARAATDQPNSLVIAAGDLIGASPLVSSMFHDEPSIEALNAMGLAVASVGNHEFDEGWEELLRMKRGGCHPADGCQDGDPFDGARFDYLSANVVRKSDGATLFPAVTERVVGGVRIGFIGITTVETAEIVPPSVTQALDFRDEAAAANAQAAALARRGVGVIVLLIHEGLRQRGGGANDPNGCVDPGGSLSRILAQLSDQIGLVVSGHTHAPYNCRIGNRLVTSAGSYGRLFTRISVQVDPRSGRVAGTSAVNEIVTRDVPKDPRLAPLVGKYTALAERVANESVGSVTTDLRNRADAAGETALGRIIADAQLQAARDEVGGRAVVAFMNRGGIRADILVDAAPAPGGARAVTYRDLHTVQPFGNTVMTFTMTGAALQRLLEEQFENGEEGRPQILQVSRGFSYRYRARAAAGQHIEAGSLQLNGRPIAPADRIRVATSDFLLNGGDGFRAFSEGTEHQSVMTDLEALVGYFKAHSPVEPPTDTRITRVDQ